MASNLVAMALNLRTNGSPASPSDVRTWEEERGQCQVPLTYWSVARFGGYPLYESIHRWALTYGH